MSLSSYQEGSAGKGYYNFGKELEDLKAGDIIRFSNAYDPSTKSNNISLYHNGNLALAHVESIGKLVNGAIQEFSGSDSLVGRDLTFNYFGSSAKAGDSLARRGDSL